MPNANVPNSAKIRAVVEMNKGKFCYRQVLLQELLSEDPLGVNKLLYRTLQDPERGVGNWNAKSHDSYFV
ncbi:jg27050 [Pararge aegeria aegeria]|uniref:Jg27050 protein n=1 Tax=Pararge aegeria aegeria TaxID=348720 RepID=A0A8S4QRY1_9NEOP|nr:jg27050 [Pararge aegeria aegeria]